MSLIENLIAAKALIDTPEKWGKEDYETWMEDGKKCLCVIGAVGSAHYKNNWWEAEHGPEISALEAELPQGEWYNIPQFNDHPDTTHADIMTLFDRAITAAERSVASC